MSDVDKIQAEINNAIDYIYEHYLFDIEAKYDIDIWVKYEWNKTGDEKE